MKKVGLFVLLAVFLVPVVAYAQSVRYVGIDGLKPLMCGTGLVPLKGTVTSDLGDSYRFLKVRFNVFGQPDAVVFTYTVPTDGTFHSWATNVNVTQGQTYKIYATLENSSGTVGKYALFYYSVSACDDAEIDVVYHQCLDAFAR